MVCCLTEYVLEFTVLWVQRVLGSRSVFGSTLRLRAGNLQPCGCLWKQNQLTRDTE